MAAISDCRRGQLRGFVSTKDETIEISPLTFDIQAQFLRDPTSLGLSETVVDSVVVEDLYLVKKAKVPTFSAIHEIGLEAEDEEEEFKIEAQVRI